MAGSYQAPGGRSVTIAAQLRRAVAGTRIYGPAPVPILPANPADPVTPPTIEVTGEGSLAAARRILQKATDPVAVLNFNPGGGFLNGAQDHVLTRRSDSPTRAAFARRFGQRRSQQSATGRLIRNVAPPPSLPSTLTAPPCAVTSEWTMAKPRPAPPVVRERDESAR